MGTQLSPPNWGTAPNFRLMSIVAERSPISATAEHLLYSSRQKVPIIYNGTTFAPSKLSLGGSGPHIIHGSWAHPSPQPKRHLDRFSRSCRAHCRPTDRQTDHATRSVTIGRIYVRSTVMRPNNIFHTHKLASIYAGAKFQRNSLFGFSF